LNAPFLRLVDPVVVVLVDVPDEDDFLEVVLVEDDVPVVA